MLPTHFQFFSAVLLCTAVIAATPPSTFKTSRVKTCPPANICYAVDESSSLSSKSFSLQTTALISLTQSLSQSLPDSLFSAVSFATTASLLIPLNSDLLLFTSLLASNTQSGGATSSGSALLLCADILANRENPVIILVTDGRDNVGPKGVDEYEKVKEQGITIASVGVGDGADGSSLREMASYTNLYIGVDSFDVLAEEIVHIAHNLCPQHSPSMSVSTTPSSSPLISLSSIPSVTSFPSIPISMMPSVSMPPLVSLLPVLTFTPAMDVEPTKTPIPSVSIPVKETGKGNNNSGNGNSSNQQGMETVAKKKPKATPLAEESHHCQDHMK